VAAPSIAGLRMHMCISVVAKRVGLAGFAGQADKVVNIPTGATLRDADMPR
jgi:hypothetical protein